MQICMPKMLVGKSHLIALLHLKLESKLTKVVYADKSSYLFMYYLQDAIIWCKSLTCSC